MSHLIFLTKKVGRNQNQGETSQGEMSQGEMSVREKCLLAVMNRPKCEKNDLKEKSATIYKVSKILLCHESWLRVSALDI